MHWADPGVSAVSNGSFVDPRCPGQIPVVGRLISVAASSEFHALSFAQCSELHPHLFKRQFDIYRLTLAVDGEPQSLSGP